MACGGFTCSKNALISLNIMYLLVAVILISVAAYGRAATIVSSVTIIGGIIACGVFLFIIALAGLLGATRHHQYMIVLFLLFLVQFSVACACLAVDEDQQHELAARSWSTSSNQTRQEAQKIFNCCGFENQTFSAADTLGHPACNADVKCCKPLPLDPCNGCDPCWEKVKNAIGSALRISGGIGLFFSFTEVNFAFYRI
ncbi:Tetraspanin-31 [Nymphon striatum]|nr:Tetraspanin-31 [Nymphon striatum]